MTPRPPRASAVACWSQSARPAFRLICIPYAGAGVSIYHKWSESLPPAVQVCALQLAGRDTHIGVPPFTRVAALVDWLVGSLDPYLDLPYAIFGHSMGGLVGYELARALRAANKPSPLHFFVSACRAPGRPVRRWPMHHLPEDGFVRELRARYNGIPDIIFQDEDLLRLFLPVLRADMEMVETWRESESDAFDFPVTAFGGIEDTEIAREDLEPWRKRTTRGFDLNMIEGNHFFVNTARSEVLRIVSDRLAAHCLPPTR
jgi:medium-chain acyl-[acyl-carrier-protein] hydrolase